MIFSNNIGFKDVRGKSKQEPTPEPPSQLIVNDHYYTFDETTGDLLDNTGSANGTLFGSITRSKTGVLNEAYGFNGSNTYVSVPGVNNEFTGSFSVGVWAKYDGNPVGTFRIMQNRGGGAAGTKVGWQLSGDITDYRNSVFDDGNGNSIDFSDVAFNESAGDSSAWHFYAITWDSSTGTASLYIDGVLKTQKTNAAMIGATLVAADNFEYGRGSQSSQYYDGDLDEGYIYKGIWTQQQITDYYNAVV